VSEVRSDRRFEGDVMALLLVEIWLFWGTAMEGGGPLKGGLSGGTGGGVDSRGTSLGSCLAGDARLWWLCSL
jgi:hypothetical protein